MLIDKPGRLSMSDINICEMAIISTVRAFHRTYKINLRLLFAFSALNKRLHNHSLPLNLQFDASGRNFFSQALSFTKIPINAVSNIYRRANSVIYHHVQLLNGHIHIRVASQYFSPANLPVVAGF